MPNFNGAIVMHTMELINSPATLREIVMTIAQNTELPSEDIKLPVKQTLEMGLRSGFLQKAEGRYYLEPITFTHLMQEMRTLGTSNIIEKPKPIKSEKSLKTRSKTFIQKIPSREGIKNPMPIPKKPVNEKALNDGTLTNPKPKKSFLDGIFKSFEPLPKMQSLYSSSMESNNKTNSASKKKSVTSLTNKPRRVNNRQ